MLWRLTNREKHWRRWFFVLYNLPAEYISRQIVSMLARNSLLPSRPSSLITRSIPIFLKRILLPALHQRSMQTLLQHSMDTAPAMMHRERRRQRLPAVLMRAGTSKGLFVRREHLPSRMEDWTVPLLAAMGSAAGDPRQIDGVGGATSTTSKVAVVAKSTVPGIDVEYTFGQVGVGKTTVDFSGNCGNMAAGVGPFALDESMVRVEQGKKTVSILAFISSKILTILISKQVDIRILNTNTSRLLVATVDVDELGQYKEDGDFKIDGVKGTGSMVRVAFLEPSGSMTGSLLPTGNSTDVIQLEGQDLSVTASLVDAANPFIFIDASTLPRKFMSRDPHSLEFLRVIENIRRVGAVMMGLSTDTKAAAVTQGTPKVAIVSAVPLWNSRDESTTADLHVAAFSMGKLHPSLQLTGAVCLGAAAVTSGTVPNRVMSAATLPTPERTPSPGPPTFNDKPKAEKKTVRIGHARGLLAVEVEHSCGVQVTEIKSAVVLRTARRLFEGNVLFYS